MIILHFATNMYWNDNAGFVNDINNNSMFPLFVLKKIEYDYEQDALFINIVNFFS